MTNSADRRIAYVVTAYNEAAAIADVIADLRQNAPPGDIIVVDDASRDDTSGAARAAGAIVLRHLINRGAGAAKQTGFDAALRRGAQVVVTLDGDGQHSAADVPVLIDALERGNADVALGSRFLGTTENMPLGRRLLLRGGIWFTRLVSRIQVSDTHNGLKAFRASALGKLRITEDRYAHCSELLDLISQHGLRHVEAPVHIRYTEYSMKKGQRWYGAMPILFDFLVGKVLR